MNTEVVGFISGLLVVTSIIPYGIRTYQGKIQPNLTTWSLWSLIGLAILLTFKSSGAEDNIWPAVFGFINPVIIVFLISLSWRRRVWTKVALSEVFGFVYCLFALGLWLLIYENKELSQYALYLALAADVFAAIPTIVFVWTNPSDDRPFAWTIFGLGYLLAIFAIPDHAPVNYVLPIFMFCLGASIATPLILHRWRQKIPLKEWI